MAWFEEAERLNRLEAEYGEMYRMYGKACMAGKEDRCRNCRFYVGGMCGHWSDEVEETHWCEDFSRRRNDTN